MRKNRKQKQQTAIREEIKATARVLIAEKGASGLSMRAIARRMEMTAPALYYYFANLADLITALVTENFHAMADALEVARDANRDRPVADQLLAVTLAVREWALAYPGDFQLIYGTPVPGYEAPREVTVPASARSLIVYVGLLAEALARGEMVPPAGYSEIPAELAAHFATLQEQNTAQAPMLALHLAMLGWPAIYGAIMLEVLGHTPPVVGDTAVFYRLYIRNIFRAMGLKL